MSEPENRIINQASFNHKFHRRLFKAWAARGSCIRGGEKLSLTADPMAVPPNTIPMKNTPMTPAIPQNHLGILPSFNFTNSSNPKAAKTATLN